MVRIKVAKIGNEEEERGFELPVSLDGICSSLEISEEQFRMEYIITTLDCDLLQVLKLSAIDADSLNDLNELAERLAKVEDPIALEAIFEAIGYTTNLERIHECFDIYGNDSYSFYRSHIDVEEMLQDGYTEVSNGIIRIDI